MGKGALASPWKCCKLFCALAVTVKRSVFFTIFWRVGVVHLVVLACVLRATSKKVVNFLRKKSATTRENPGYACEFAHPWKKSSGRPCHPLATPVSIGRICGTGKFERFESEISYHHHHHHHHLKVCTATSTTFTCTFYLRRCKYVRRLREPIVREHASPYLG